MASSSTSPQTPLETFAEACNNADINAISDVGRTPLMSVDSTSLAAATTASDSPASCSACTDCGRPCDDEHGLLGLLSQVVEDDETAEMLAALIDSLDSDEMLLHLLAAIPVDILGTLTSYLNHPLASLKDDAELLLKATRLIETKITPEALACCGRGCQKHCVWRAILNDPARVIENYRGTPGADDPGLSTRAPVLKAKAGRKDGTRQWVKMEGGAEKRHLKGGSDKFAVMPATQKAQQQERRKAHAEELLGSGYCCHRGIAYIANLSADTVAGLNREIAAGGRKARMDALPDPVTNSRALLFLQTHRFFHRSWRVTLTTNI